MAERDLQESNASRSAREANVLARAFRQVTQLSTKVALEIADQFRVDGDLEKATEIANLVESRDRDSLALLELRARIAYSGGDHAAALELLKHRAETRPSATAWIAVARLHLDAGEIDAAREISDRLLVAQPELLTVQALAGAVARAMGDPKGARMFFHAMVDLKTEHPSALLTLAELSFESGDQDVARAFYRRAVASIATQEFKSAPMLDEAARIARMLGEDAKAAEFTAQKQLVVDDRREARMNAWAAALDSIASGEPQTRPSRTTSTSSPARPAPRRPNVEPDDLETFSEPAVSASADDPRVLQTLRALFGHESLRPGQADVINKVMAGEDTLAIMPTGAGKSLTFQLPAMLRDGATIVISPLIALMKDQVDGLPAAVQAKTALINSTLSPEEMRGRLEDLRRGNLKLVYVAPERLRQHGFLKALRETKIATLVIDEAHCISMWGHDFRPDYLFIPRALSEIGEPPVLAITATATQATARQISEGLRPQINAGAHQRLPAQSLLFGRALRQPRRKNLGDDRVLPNHARLGHRLCLVTQGRRRDRRPAPQSPDFGRSLSRRHEPRRPLAGPGKLHVGPGPDRGGDGRVRHGHRQVRCPLHRPLFPAGVA